MKKLVVGAVSLAVFGGVLIPGVAAAQPPERDTVDVTCNDEFSFTADAHAEDGLNTAVAAFNEHNPLDLTCSVE